MNDSRTLDSTPEEEPWHLLKRIAFRFAFCYIALYYAGSVLALIPGGPFVAVRYTALWNWLAGPVITSVLGLDRARAIPHQTGSGDTLLSYVQNAAMLLLALIAGIAWTALDRYRPHYAGLHGWLRVLARYALAFALLSYGLAKVLPVQFPALTSSRLSVTYGASSPMALLWNFMGYSTAYTVFAGCAEMLPAFLLLFRRTALLGALLAAGVMLNVVMLNFCYDVPVKLYSVNLLCLSVFLVLPDAPRLFRMFVQNRPTSPSNCVHPVLKTLRLRQLALTLKVAVLAIFVGQGLYSGLLRLHESRTPPAPTPLTSRGFNWSQEYPYNR